MATPPNYNTLRPGRGRARSVSAPRANGKHIPNMSIPPLVHTNGIGERVEFTLRSGKVYPPKKTQRD